MLPQLSYHHFFFQLVKLPLLTQRLISRAMKQAVRSVSRLLVSAGKNHWKRICCGWSLLTLCRKRLSHCGTHLCRYKPRSNTISINALLIFTVLSFTAFFSSWKTPAKFSRFLHIADANHCSGISVRQLCCSVVLLKQGLLCRKQTECRNREFSRISFVHSLTIYQ